jgi:small-conductance mechanosensitive channel
MGLVQLVVLLIVIGVGLYALNRYVPMEGTIRNLVNLVVILVALLLVLGAFGLLPMPALR